MSAHAHGRLTTPRPVAWWWIIMVCAALVVGAVLAEQRHLLPGMRSRHAPALVVPAGCPHPAQTYHAPPDLLLPPAMVIIQQANDPSGTLVTACTSESLRDTVAALQQTWQQGWQPVANLPQDSDATLAFTRADQVVFARCYRQATTPPTVIVIFTQPR